MTLDTLAHLIIAAREAEKLQTQARVFAKPYIEALHDAEKKTTQAWFEVWEAGQALGLTVVSKDWDCLTSAFEKMAAEKAEKSTTAAE